MKYFLNRNLILKASLVIVSVFTLSEVAYAASGSQYTFSGGFPSSTINNLKYVMSGGDSSYQTNIMKAGVEAWNGDSSKVHISLNSSGATVSVYKSSTNNPDLQGLTNPYYRNSLGVLTLDSNDTNIWSVVDIFGYDNNMTAKGYTTAQKKAIFTHEMGHTLSLAHNDSTYYLIMNTYSNDTIQALTPKSDDIANLRLKWGN